MHGPLRPQEREKLQRLGQALDKLSQRQFPPMSGGPCYGPPRSYRLWDRFLHFIARLLGQA